MFCSNCGTQIDEGAGFCPNCGTKLTSDEVTEPVKTGEPTEIKKRTLGDKAFDKFASMIGGQEITTVRISMEDMLALVKEHIIETATSAEDIKKIISASGGGNFFGFGDTYESADGKYTLVSYNAPTRAGSGLNLLHPSDSSYVMLTDHETGTAYNYYAFSIGKFKKAVKAITSGVNTSEISTARATTAADTISNTQNFQSKVGAKSEGNPASTVNMKRTSKNDIVASKSKGKGLKIAIIVGVFAVVLIGAIIIFDGDNFFGRSYTKDELLALCKEQTPFLDMGKTQTIDSAFQSYFNGGAWLAGEDMNDFGGYDLSGANVVYSAVIPDIDLAVNSDVYEYCSDNGMYFPDGGAMLVFGFEVENDEVSYPYVIIDDLNDNSLKLTESTEKSLLYTIYVLGEQGMTAERSFYEDAGEESTETIVQQETENLIEPLEDELVDDISLHSYSLVIDDVSWGEAFYDAIRAGGYLARINSEDEYEAIVGMLNEGDYGSTHFYIGGGREPNSSEYYWVNEDGRAFDGAINNSADWYRWYWYDGEPSYEDTYAADNGGDIIEEDALSLFCVSGEWYLNDTSSDIKKDYPGIFDGKIGYIIEFE